MPPRPFIVYDTRTYVINLFYAALWTCRNYHRLSYGRVFAPGGGRPNLKKSTEIEHQFFSVCDFQKEPVGWELSKMAGSQSVMTGEWLTGDVTFLTVFLRLRTAIRHPRNYSGLSAIIRVDYYLPPANSICLCRWRVHMCRCLRCHYVAKQGQRAPQQRYSALSINPVNHAACESWLLIYFPQ